MISDKWALFYSVLTSYFGLSKNVMKLFNLGYLFYYNEYIHLSDLLNFSITSIDKINTWAHDKSLPNYFFILYFITKVKWDEVATPVVKELLLHILKLMFRLLNGCVDLLIKKISRKTQSSEIQCELMSENCEKTANENNGKVTYI